MELEDTSIDALKATKVSKVRKMVMTHMDNFTKMDDNNTIDFTMTGAGQTYFFQQWFLCGILGFGITYTAGLISLLSDK